MTFSCNPGRNAPSPFAFTVSDQKIELREDTSMVLVYQKKPKTLTGEYVCNNYIHPLFDLRGNILTEEFPPDHPYHRGVFWAWHQLYADGKRLGDGWTNDSITQEVVKVTARTASDRADIDTHVKWRSLVYGNGKPFMNEHTTITVHKIVSGIRKIDFEIRLTAAVSGLEIGGADDQKGYGGFCVRLRLPDSLVFTSGNGPLTPQEMQIKAGPWMDFSGRFGITPEESGLAILCNPSMPGYPEPWILRQKGSMQNAVFPGRQRISVGMDKDLVLKYRLIIHNGGADSVDLPALLEEYAEHGSK